MSRWREPKARASPEVLRWLPGIAEQLLDRHRTRSWQSEKDRFHISSTKNRTLVIVDHIPRKYVRELGGLLLQLAEGANARLLFRQDERKKPSKVGKHRAISLAYYSVRALNPRASDAPALRKARSLFPEFADASDATIRKYAQRYRDTSLATLRERVSSWGLTNRKVIHGRTKAQVDALAEHLRRKREGHWPLE